MRRSGSRYDGLEPSLKNLCSVARAAQKLRENGFGTSGGAAASNMGICPEF